MTAWAEARTSTTTPSSTSPSWRLTQSDAAPLAVALPSDLTGPGPATVDLYCAENLALLERTERAVGRHIPVDLSRSAVRQRQGLRCAGGWRTRAGKRRRWMPIGTTGLRRLSGLAEAATGVLPRSAGGKRHAVRPSRLARGPLRQSGAGSPLRPRAFFERDHLVLPRAIAHPQRVQAQARHDPGLHPLGWLFLRCRRRARAL